MIPGSESRKTDDLDWYKISFQTTGLTAVVTSSLEKPWEEALGRDVVRSRPCLHSRLRLTSYNRIMNGLLSSTTRTLHRGRYPANIRDPVNLMYTHQAPVSGCLIIRQFAIPVHLRTALISTNHILLPSSPRPFIARIRNHRCLLA